MMLGSQLLMFQNDTVLPNKRYQIGWKTKITAGLTTPPSLFNNGWGLLGVYFWLEIVQVGGVGLSITAGGLTLQVRERLFRWGLVPLAHYVLDMSTPMSTQMFTMRNRYLSGTISILFPTYQELRSGTFAKWDHFFIPRESPSYWRVNFYFTPDFYFSSEMKRSSSFQQNSKMKGDRTKI